MDPMSGWDIRLVFTLEPRDSTNCSTKNAYTCEKPRRIEYKEGAIGFPQKLVLQQSKYVTAKFTETLLPPPCFQFSLEITIFKLEFFVLNHGYRNRVSQRGSRTNERSIRYGEKDLYLSDVTD